MACRGEDPGGKGCQKRRPESRPHGQLLPVHFLGATCCLHSTHADFCLCLMRCISPKMPLQICTEIAVWLAASALPGCSLQMLPCHWHGKNCCCPSLLTKDIMCRNIMSNNTAFGTAQPPKKLDAPPSDSSAAKEGSSAPVDAEWEAAR